ncbi:MAG TPA: efflux RND transporter periplasmic adaptor subunit [Arenicellales bacterium]|nr:efflux RND transporter periplasmic adaptor subunit [Arenicellales bacterium]
MRIPRNYWLAGAIALAVVLWMLSGVLDRESAGGVDGGSESDLAGKPFKVEMNEIRAESIQRHITAQGQVRPERAATLRARTAGQVEAVLVESGQRVAEGELLVRLSMDDRQSRLEEARALVQQRLREHEAAQRLGASGLQSEVQQDQAAAALASARAALERIELDIAHTRITAPFEGMVDQVMVDVGDYATAQSEITTLVDNSPLVAEVWLSQRHFNTVRVGGEAQVTLVSGQTREGRVIAVAPRADESSRTFRVEIGVDNPDRVPANTSAEVVLPIDIVTAHRVSPAVLELDDSGRLGIKLVDDEQRVDFRAVEIVRADADGVWVTGLPDPARVITTGGGFVAPGQNVEAIPAG